MPSTDETDLTSILQWKKVLLKYHWLYKPLSFIGLYGLWILIFRLLTLTFITYFIISPSSHFQDISDAFSSNEVSLMGLAAFLFVGLLCSLYPLTSTRRIEIINQDHAEREFLPGFIRGAFLASGLILFFILSGAYHYLGYFIQIGEVADVGNIIFRIIALSALSYCEEFIFHYKIATQLNNHLPAFASAHLIAFLYCAIKILQFDLGIMHLFTLYLISISLFYRIQNGGKFSRTAGFWAGILIIFNPLLSLPIFGSEFQGILWFKYQNTEPGTSLARILTGGVGGPISSLAFQLLLIIDIARSILRNKKTP